MQKLALTLFVALLASIITFNPSSFQEKLQENLYHDMTPAEEIVIVYIDEHSLSDEMLGRWQDWSREYYAKAIENLEGAAVIGIDLVFNRKSTGLSEEALIETLATNKTSDELIEDQLAYLEKDHPDDLALAEAMEKSGNVFLVKYPDTTSIDLISKTAAGEGYSYGELSQSSAVLKINAKNSFDLQIAEFFSGKTYSPPLDEQGQMYINYAGPAGSYKYFSFSDIYNGTFNQNEIQGKIVLIGVGTPTLQDNYTVPLGENLMYGVEIHANTIQTILEENFLQKTTKPEQTVINFILLAAAMGLFLHLKIFATIPVLPAAVAGYWLLALTAFRNGTILDLVHPYLALATLYLIAIIYRYLTEIHKRKQIKSAFSHYVSKDVVDEVLKNPETLHLGGEKKVITTFFADIANFTSWAEKENPEKLTAQLNEYFSIFSEIIMKNGGTVDKFEGDAIMAFWGAPLAVENQEELACETALEALTKIPNIKFKVGIATGEAVVGNLGSKERFDYTAVGDTVNLAARLETANKFYGTKILVAEKTAAKLADKFAWRRLDKVRVKGKQDAVTIYELLPRPHPAINTFHQAIEYYKNADWQGARERFQEVLTQIPDDGPTKTYLARIAKLENNTPENWDGVWEFGEK